MQSMTVQLDIDVTSSSNGQSEKTILDFEPVTCGQHQLPSIWKPCAGILLFDFSIVVEYYGGFADSAQPIVSEHVTAETMIRFRRESLETGNVLFYSNRDADVHHAPELVKQT